MASVRSGRSRAAAVAGLCELFVCAMARTGVSVPAQPVELNKRDAKGVYKAMTRAATKLVAQAIANSSNSEKGRIAVPSGILSGAREAMLRVPQVVDKDVIDRPRRSRGLMAGRSQLNRGHQ
jgi:hypothetical protein